MRLRECPPLALKKQVAQNGKGLGVPCRRARRPGGAGGVTGSLGAVRPISLSRVSVSRSSGINLSGGISFSQESHPLTTRHPPECGQRNKKDLRRFSNRQSGIIIPEPGSFESPKAIVSLGWKSRGSGSSAPHFELLGLEIRGSRPLAPGRAVRCARPRGPSRR